MVNVNVRQLNSLIKTISRYVSEVAKALVVLKAMKFW